MSQAIAREIRRPAVDTLTPHWSLSATREKGKPMKNINILAQSGVALLFGATILQAADTADVQGYWAGGYTDGQGGEIQFEMTVIDGVGELKYNASNWGALGFGICEYLFPLENGQPGTVTRNSAAGTGDCLAEPAFTLSRATPDAISLVFKNPEVALDAVELGGVLRPFDPAAAHAPVAGLDILGIAPGMTFDAIDPVLSEKGYARQEARDNTLEYEGYKIAQKVWGRDQDGDGQPEDWVFATFTSERDWATDDTPVATDVGRDWQIPASENVSGATMVDGLAKKYGARSNTINEDRMYDRAGAVMADTLSCPEGAHQPITSNYMLDSEQGSEEIAVTCGPILKAYVGSDSDTGRATWLKLHITDPDPLWDDFWKTWSHGEGARLKSVFDGVTGATGAAPEL